MGIFINNPGLITNGEKFCGEKWLLIAKIG
jgi:hypothetical protein